VNAASGVLVLDVRVVDVSVAEIADRALTRSLMSTPVCQPPLVKDWLILTKSTTCATRELPLASFRLRWSQSMPESSTAMPTPLPSSAVLLLIGGAAELPVASCTRLAVRAATRLGAMASTSLRAARAFSAATGTMPDSARTET